jgi:4-amino-4-deoxy-L-arabinose transferase-like glycosyltransferase
MTRRHAVFALVLALLAGALPVQSTAIWLAGADAPRLAQVVTGIWVFKALLLLHAAILALLGWVRPPQEAAYIGGLAADGKRPVWEVPLVGGLLLLALGLRLWHLGTGLWFDEIQTLVDYVRRPMGEILTLFDSKNQHLLYSVLARAAFQLFGESGWALRLPAALMGTASLWALYRLARMIAPAREALLGVALLAVSYHHVWFSQNARGYTGLLLFSLLGTTALLRLLGGRAGPGFGTAAEYGGWMALAIYTHVTAVFIVAAHALVWLGCWWAAPAARRDWRPLLALALAGSFALLLYAPVLPQFLATVTAPTMEGTRTAWKTPLWFVTESLRVLQQGIPGGLVTVGVAGLVMVAGLLSYWRQSRALVALMLLPALLSAGAFVALSHNLWPRFFFFAAGFLVLIALRGGFVLAERILPPRLGWVPVAGGVIVALVSLSTVPRAWHPKQDYEGARDYVRAHAAPGDAVVAVDLIRYPCDHYYACGFEAVDSAARLTAVAQQHPATWVLYTFPIRLAAVAPEIWQQLQTQYRQAAVFRGTVGGGDIVVMRSTPDSH